MAKLISEQLHRELAALRDRSRGRPANAGSTPTGSPLREAAEGLHVFNQAAEEMPALSIFCFQDAADKFSVHQASGFAAAKIQKPSTAFRRRLGISGLGPVADGKTGFFRVRRYYRVRYDDADGTPVPGQVWGPKPGQWTIAKNFYGCLVWGVVDETHKIALVELDSPITQLYIKATTAIAADAVATGNKYDILTGTLGSETDGGWTTVPDFENKGVAFASGDYGWLTWGPNGWHGGKVC